MSTYEYNLTPIKILYSSISNWVDEETHYRFFKRICDEFDSKWKIDFKKNYWRNSEIRKILQVHERLNLTDTLNEDIGDDFLRRHMYPQLITYLRLTCFDQLGQPANWMIFSDWLKSKKKKDEKTRIFESIEAVNKLEFTEKIYQEYQKIYGIKNSFFNFIKNVIPQETRRELLNLIKIRIHDETSPTIEGRAVTDKDKEDYLYKIRNDFTHSTYSTSPIKNFQKIKESEWNFRETIYKEKESYWISTHENFEDKLKETVLIGIAEIIKSE
jgi:hypothetical protein